MSSAQAVATKALDLQRSRNLFAIAVSGVLATRSVTSNMCVCVCAGFVLWFSVHVENIENSLIMRRKKNHISMICLNAITMVT